MIKNSVRQAFTENTKFDTSQIDPVHIVDWDIVRWEDDGGLVQADNEYDDRVTMRQHLKIIVPDRTKKLHGC